MGGYENRIRNQLKIKEQEGERGVSGGIRGRETEGIRRVDETYPTLFDTNATPCA